MGYIEIPKLDLRLSIAHGTDEDVLQKMVGHVEGTSLPVGGESTHGRCSLRTAVCRRPSCSAIWI